MVPAALAILAMVPFVLGAIGAADAGPSVAGAAHRTGTVGGIPSAAQPLPLALGTTAAPTVICAGGTDTCPVGVSESRVQLSVNTLGSPAPSWPNVQIVFVLDTTSFAGDFGTDSNGLDPCAGNDQPACEESNGIPVFVAHAGQIALSIAAANPHSKVTFAMVDYYDAWGSGWDDADGPEYHVDFSNFVAASEVQEAVQSTFVDGVLAGGWNSWDQDLDNNFLDSSTITALYGSIVGSGLNWSAGTHHVIVWMGITAPRAPGYEQNYCVSESAWIQWGEPPDCYSQSCEPSYVFLEGSSPDCEGWTTSNDGNPNDSIAALARTAPQCTDSVGGVCTIDTIDLWGTPTDPNSRGWPKSSIAGSGPGGAKVIENVDRVLEAGCRLAAATGGTWDGPAWYTCTGGSTGTLEYVPHGLLDKPNTNNPTLLAAFRQIGFGPVYLSEVAKGTDKPMFQFVPGTAITLASNPDWATSCTTLTGFSPNCPRDPTIQFAPSGFPVYGWNWSTNASANALFVGDQWTAEFNIIATGPTASNLPVDACDLLVCRDGGSGPRAGWFTAANYLAFKNTTVEQQSFPLATVQVEVSPSVGGLSQPPPPPPPPPPGIPVPASVPLTVSNPQTVVVQSPISTASLQGVAASALGAGFIRVATRNRPIANVNLRAGATKNHRSKFEGGPDPEGRSSVGRFV